MKLSEIEDTDKIVSKEYLDIALGRLENQMDRQFNALDARINRVERSIWLLVLAAILQVSAIFSPLIVKLFLIK